MLRADAKPTELSDSDRFANSVIDKQTPCPEQPLWHDTELHLLLWKGERGGKDH